MDFNKFTQKSLEAIQNCQKIAYEYGNQEIDEEHLLYSLLTMEDSLIAKLIGKMEINDQGFIYQAEKLVAKRVKVSGQVQVYLSGALNQALMQAETEAKQMDDEYISVEHLFLALIAKPNQEIKQLFKNLGLRETDF